MLVNQSLMPESDMKRKTKVGNNSSSNISELYLIIFEECIRFLCLIQNKTWRQFLTTKLTNHGRLTYVTTSVIL